MKIIEKLVISNDAPIVPNALWLKPALGGYTPKVYDNGWKPLTSIPLDVHQVEQYDIQSVDWNSLPAMSIPLYTAQEFIRIRKNIVFTLIKGNFKAFKNITDYLFSDFTALVASDKDGTTSYTITGKSTADVSGNRLIVLENQANVDIAKIVIYDNKITFENITGNLLYLKTLNVLGSLFEGVILDENINSGSRVDFHVNTDSLDLASVNGLQLYGKIEEGKLILFATTRPGGEMSFKYEAINTTATYTQFLINGI